MADRRQLAFAGLDDVMPAVEQLLVRHETVGTWTLGQILNHLATALRLTTAGTTGPSGSTPEQAIARRLFFRRGTFPENQEAPLPAMQPGPDLDAATEARALRAAIDRFASAEGDFATHPRLGPLTKDQWARFHVLHCAHHLGFALPL